MTSTQTSSPLKDRRITGGLYEHLRILTKIWMLCLLGLSSGISFQSAAQEAEHPFSVVAYLPEYRLSQVTSRQLAGVTDLVFFGIEPSPDGKLPASPIKAETLKSLKQFRLNAGCRLLICVGGWGRSEHFPALAADAESRLRFITSMKAYCLEHDFAGIDYDWEHPRNAKELDAYAVLLAETRTAFEPHALMVTVAQASWQDLGSKAYQAVNRVHLMSYDHAYPQATLETSMADIERLKTFGCPLPRIALGLPFYGRNRQRQAKTYRELIEQTAFDPGVDEIRGFAFNGQATIAKKVDFAMRTRLNGIMIWEIGQDTLDPRTSLLQVIRQGITNPSPTKTPSPSNQPP